jgi:hypothetical protein
VVYALRMSSHVGANRFDGSIARAVGFAQWICTAGCTDVLLRSVFTQPRHGCRVSDAGDAKDSGDGK